jgi:hypothetical protein
MRWSSPGCSGPAITVVAELGDLTRFDNPRELGAFVRVPTWPP